MWKDKLQEIAQKMSLYGEKINIGASPEEIQLFLKEVKAEIKVDLPKEYIQILEVINGIEFNGFILYGIDQYLLYEQPKQAVNGLIDCNMVWYENEWQKQYIFLGESHISWYVYDLTEGKYCELDNPSGSKSGVFDSLESLVEKVLGDALA